MKHDLQKHRLRSIRLMDYDYSQAGAYYITIDVQNRDCLFGNIVNNEMILNKAGKMIAEQWNALPERFPNIELDLDQVMPNHFHGIIVIVGAAFMAAQVVVAQDVTMQNAGENWPGTSHCPYIGFLANKYARLVSTSTSGCGSRTRVSSNSKPASFSQVSIS